MLTFFYLSEKNIANRSQSDEGGIYPIFVLLYFIIQLFLSKFSSILRLTLK